MYSLYRFLGAGFRIFFVVLCFAGYMPDGIICFPLSLIFGWLIASKLDRSINPFYNKDVMTSEEHVLFRRVSFGLFGYVAKGRGNVIKEQIDYLEKVIENLPVEERRELHKAFSEGKTTEPAPGCARLVQLSHGNHHLLHQFIEMCVFITLCDGVLEPEERVRLLLITRLLGVPDYVTERFIKQQMVFAHFNYFKRDDTTQNRYGSQSENSYSSSSSNSSSDSQSGYNSNQSSGRAYVPNNDYENALKVIGVADGTPFLEIKKAYLKLMKRYHPDRIAALNASEEMKKVYTEKAQTIQQAFEVIKAKHGVK